MNFFLNSKGQGDEVFRLLIGAVLGLAILLVVLGIVTNVEQEKFRLSMVRFDDGFQTAVNLPTGETVIQKDLFFKEGEIISALSLAQQFKVQKECIEFFSSHNRVQVLDNGSWIETNAVVQTHVFFDCQNNVNSCFPYCRVSFGSQLPSP